MSMTFREIVAESLAYTLKHQDDATKIPGDLASNMFTLMHRQGLAVHRVADCVRPGPPPPGREMTAADRALVDG